MISKETFSALVKAWNLIEHDKRGRWVLLAALAVVVSALESIGAILIYGLISAMSGMEAVESLPIVGPILQGIEGLTAESVLLAAAFLVALFFSIRGVAYVTQSYLQNRIAHNAIARISTRLFRGYLTLPYEFHLHRDSAGAIRNLHHSTFEAVNSLYIPVLGIFSEMLIIVGILGVVTVTAPVVTLVLLGVTLPLFFVMSRKVQPRLAHLGKLNQHLSHMGLKSIQEIFHGIRDIKVLGRESFFESQFAVNRSEAARAMYGRAVLIDLPRVIMETTLMLLLVCGLALTIVRGRSIEESLSLLALIGYAMLRVLPSLNRVMASMNIIRFGIPAVEHLYEDLRLINETASDSNGSSPLRFEDAIRLRDVSFEYRTRGPVLDRINLTIPKGGSLGIVGPTGGGKSTLIDVLVGLLPPTEGAVEIDGRDINDFLRTWQKAIGLVSQTVFLIDDSIQRNIALGQSDVDEDRMSEAVAISQLTDIVATSSEGLGTSVGEGGIRLSGGQRQRVALARALYNNPQVLVLDEGTSALDEDTEKRFLQALRTRRPDCTVVMVAHRISSLRYCDDVAVVKEGRIERHVKHSDLENHLVELDRSTR